MKSPKQHKPPKYTPNGLKIQNSIKSRVVIFKRQGGDRAGICLQITVKQGEEFSFAEFGVSTHKAQMGGARKDTGMCSDKERQAAFPPRSGLVYTRNNYTETVFI